MFRSPNNSLWQHCALLQSGFAGGCLATNLCIFQKALNYSQQLLIIYRSGICKFAYWLICICNPKTNTHSAFGVIHKHSMGIHRVATCLSRPRAHHQLMLCSLVSALMLQTSVLFCLFSVMVFTFCSSFGESAVLNGLQGQC